MNDLSLFHVTNGESAASAIREAGISGEILTWDDPLHDGPAPAGLSPDEFSMVRAGFVADCGWGDAAEIRSRFRERDRRLRDVPQDGETALWFEHDLYDQLQLIQILDRVGGKAGRLTLAQSGDHLAELDASGLQRLFDGRRAVSADQVEEAREAWAAFTAPDPRGLAATARRTVGGLPFLPAALRRHLEELPWTIDGLSRTERAAIRAVAGGSRSPGEIFRAVQAAEEARYLGDWSFWLILERLHRGKSPLLAAEGGAFQRPPAMDQAQFLKLRIGLTEAGRAVLGGEADQVRLNGCDRWLGGVRLVPAQVWRWDPEAGSPVGGPRREGEPGAP